MVRLIPRDEKFFDLFVEDGENLLEAARKLEQMVTSYDRLDERVAEIQVLEKKGDAIDDELVARLQRSFITPFDREDIHELEHKADGLSRAAIGRLFRDGNDPLEVIKLRDLYTVVEETIDAAEDAAEVIERILAKS
jgi:uncharacterized protein Yka (UPF0111/DUF47 family)